MYVCTLESLDAIGKANWIVKAMYVCTLESLDAIGKANWIVKGIDVSKLGCYIFLMYCNFWKSPILLSSILILRLNILILRLNILNCI